MIKFLSGWIEQIVISVVIVSIFEMIIPNGNIKKYIKVALGIYITFCIISPFVNSQKLFAVDEIDLETMIEKSKMQTNINQESMDKRLEKLYIEELEKNINTKLSEFGYEISKSKIDANLKSDSENPGIHYIKLTIKKSKKNNINIERVEIGDSSNLEDNEEEKERIKKEIANYLEVDEKNIDIKISS